MINIRDIAVVLLAKVNLGVLGKYIADIFEVFRCLKHGNLAILVWYLTRSV